MVSPKALAAYRAWREAEEAQQATTVIDAFGVGWAFPAAMPARLWLWATSRPGNKLLADLTFADVDDLAGMVVPDEIRDDWLSLPGLSRDDYHAAVVKVVVSYLFPEAGAASGGAAESTSQTSSSETSGSSTPTSPANTPTDIPEDSGPNSKPD